MTKLTKGQEIIKERYFRLNNHDPLNYCPISDKTLVFAPHTLVKIIDVIIKILEEEYDGGIIWKLR